MWHIFQKLMKTLKAHVFKKPSSLVGHTNVANSYYNEKSTSGDLERLEYTLQKNLHSTFLEQITLGKCKNS